MPSTFSVVFQSGESSADRSRSHLIVSAWVRGLYVLVLGCLVFSGLAHGAETKRAPVEVRAMAPLLIADPRTNNWQSSPSWHEFYQQCVQAGEMGVTAITMDGWTSLNFEYWEQVIQTVYDAGAVRDGSGNIIDRKMRTGVGVCGHVCGVNVGDGNIFIDIDPRLKDLISGSVRVRQIVLKYPPNATDETKQGIRERMRTIRSEATPDNFETLARKHSDENSKNGGDLGWIKRGITLAPAPNEKDGRDASLNLLEAGQIGPIVEKDNGVYLLQLAEVDERHPDLAYVSEVGARNPSLVSIWGFPYVIDYLEEQWRRVHNHFKHRVHQISSLNFSFNSAGEIRTSAYDQHDRDAGHEDHADWPGRGLMQISSPLAQGLLRKAMKVKYGTIAKLNKAWGTSYGSWNSFYALRTKPEVDAFIESGALFEQMGQDITGWQQRSLIESVQLFLRRIISVFHYPGSEYEEIPIEVKVPGVFWSFHNRFPLIASGLNSTEGANSPKTELPVLGQQPSYYPPSWTEENGQGLGPLLAGIAQVQREMREDHPKTKIVVLFTSGEKHDCTSQCVFHPEGDPKCECVPRTGKRERSGGKTLAHGFAVAANQNGVAWGIETGLPVYNEAEYQNMLLLLEKGGESATFLRTSNLVDPKNVHALKYIRNIKSLHAKPAVPATAGGAGDCVAAMRAE